MPRRSPTTRSGRSIHRRSAAWRRSARPAPAARSSTATLTTQARRGPWRRRPTAHGSRSSIASSTAAPICTGTCHYSTPTAELTQITNYGDVAAVDWQPIPVNAYPRPKGASRPGVARAGLCSRARPQPHPRPAARLRLLPLPGADLGRADGRHPRLQRQAHQARAATCATTRCPATPRRPPTRPTCGCTAIVNDVRVAIGPRRLHRRARGAPTLQITDKHNTPTPVAPARPRCRRSPTRGRPLHRDCRHHGRRQLQPRHDRRGARARRREGVTSARSGRWCGSARRRRRERVHEAGDLRSVASCGSSFGLWTCSGPRRREREPSTPPRRSSRPRGSRWHALCSRQDWS